MMNTVFISGVIVENYETLTFEEFCRATQSNEDLILQMIEYQLLNPTGKTQEDWRFDSVCLRRARIASNFFCDLEVNIQGVALALELLDRIESLQQQVDFLKKIVKSS